MPPETNFDDFVVVVLYNETEIPFTNHQSYINSSNALYLTSSLTGGGISGTFNLSIGLTSVFIHAIRVPFPFSLQKNGTIANQNENLCMKSEAELEKYHPSSDYDYDMVTHTNLELLYTKKKKKRQS